MTEKYVVEGGEMGFLHGVNAMHFSPHCLFFLKKISFYKNLSLDTYCFNISASFSILQTINYIEPPNTSH